MYMTQVLSSLLKLRLLVFLMERRHGLRDAYFLSAGRVAVIR